MSPKRAQKGSKCSLKFVVAAALIVCCGILLFGDEESDVLVDELEFYHVKMDKAGFRHNHKGEYVLRAKKAIRKAETVFQIPRFLCVSEEDVSQSSIVMQLTRLTDDVDRALESTGSSPSFKQILRFAFYVAMEKRNALSPLQRWFNTIPQFDRSTGGALFWDDEDLECLDPATLWEAQTMRTGLLSSHAVASVVCSEEDECTGGSLSVEELRWALAVYFHYNLRDQAIVPFLTFARFTAINFGVDVKVNRNSGGLDVVANDLFAQGDEIGIFYPRGPSGQFVARGVVDDFALGIDARIDLRAAIASKSGRRICIDHSHEMMFGSNGRPREALIKCYAWLIGDEQSRQQIESYATNSELMSRVRKGLKHVVAEAMLRIPRSCATSHSALRRKIDALNNFTRVVLERNLDFFD
jgi:hypothetical protein